MPLFPGLTTAPLVEPLDDKRRRSLVELGVAIHQLGQSAEGRDLIGLTVGASHLPLISVVAGSHPDEPAGPVAALHCAATWGASALGNRCRLALVLQVDVDGTLLQQDWLRPWGGAVDPMRYLAHRLRRQPGEDREFAYPGAPWGGTVLPECAAAADFLEQQGPAIAHCSLHGMFASAGAWFLLDALGMRNAHLWFRLQTLARSLDLGLHDMPRNGDKGFRRAGLGFCTIPNGRAMRRFFLQRNDQKMADGFGLSSMEWAKALAERCGAPEPLCAVSEFPLMVADELRGLPVSDMRSLMPKLMSAGRLRPVPLVDQARGMVGMVHAVAEAALG